MMELGPRILQRLGLSSGPHLSNDPDFKLPKTASLVIIIVCNILMQVYVHPAEETQITDL